MTKNADRMFDGIELLKAGATTVLGAALGVWAGYLAKDLNSDKVAECATNLISQEVVINKLDKPVGCEGFNFMDSRVVIEAGRVALHNVTVPSKESFVAEHSDDANMAPVGFGVITGVVGLLLYPLASEKMEFLAEEINQKWNTRKIRKLMRRRRL